jgi:ATP-dependent exoDNAse (exonuclease V) beta subunit
MDVDVNDSATRETALDPGRSFIVQAPAGSGKTELLIQRYLRLLATVELPEQIIAITFTRKAAAEMRGRVLAALQSAAASEPVESAHLETTRTLALDALRQSERQEWDLLMQPQRLRIDTLDALNAWLALRLPLLSGGISGADVAEDASELHQRAAIRILRELGSQGELGDALRALLRRLDNGYERLERLLTELIPRRDQWLKYVVSGEDTALRDRLEESLERLVSELLQDFADRLPDASKPELVLLLRHAARHCSDPTLANHFAPWRSLDRLPEPCSESLAAWRAIPELLVVGKGTWRQRLGPGIGFAATHKLEQERLRELISWLADEPGLEAAVSDLRKLPDPRYRDDDWETLVALRHVLRHLTAELRVVFAERRSVDFTEIAQAADSALGATDAPSDLLLALDRRIQHLLVDEFQDTSHPQFEMLRKLTSGWERDDGRTLFLVGDPMQSIYRFRNADMSLFLRTKSLGIGDVVCEPLVLSNNFRSAPAVLDWVNETFAGIFPEEDDLGSGAAKFSPCAVTRPAGDDLVQLHAIRAEEPEAEIERTVSVLVDERMRYPDRSVAILVQSRSHLAGLREKLRLRNLDVHAVELEAPNRSQVVQDLIGLTRALLHRADRIAWLAILRAPWCGLTWTDLELLAGRDRDGLLWDQLNDPETSARLSADGQRRAAALRDVLQLAFEHRGQTSLARWVELTWETLGGPACVNRYEDFDDAERFFDKLSELDRRGDIDDPATLESFFLDPRGQREAPRESGIEIMTIHRAKGLEFDTVLLLGLGRPPRPEPGRALYWLERIASDGTDDLLLAPLTAADTDDNRLVALLRSVEADRDRRERARLLYVAATRARNRLHVIAQLKPNRKEPDPRSLLAQLWPLARNAFDVAPCETNDGVTAVEEINPALRRLVDPVVPEVTAARIDIEPRRILRPEFAWAGPAALQVGVVVHELLQMIADDGSDLWNAERIDERVPITRAQLELLGVEKEHLEAATGRVNEALLAVLADETGRWLLDDHEEASSELALTLRTDAGIEHLRLDRTFIDDGTRWIVDIKTSTHEGGSRSAFLDSEQDRYREQLERYASAMRAIDDRPIRVGLYFPLLGEFRAWQPKTDSLN